MVEFFLMSAKACSHRDANPHDRSHWQHTHSTKTQEHAENFPQMQDATTHSLPRYHKKNTLQRSPDPTFSVARPLCLTIDCVRHICRWVWTSLSMLARATDRQTDALEDMVSTQITQNMWRLLRPNAGRGSH